MSTDIEDVKTIKHDFTLVNRLEVSLKIYGEIIPEKTIISRNPTGIEVNVSFCEGPKRKRYKLWLTTKEIADPNVVFQQTIPSKPGKENWCISITKN